MVLHVHWMESFLQARLFGEGSLAFLILLNLDMWFVVFKYHSAAWLLRLN